MTLLIFSAYFPIFYLTHFKYWNILYKAHNYSHLSPLPYLVGLNKPTNDNNIQIQILSFKNLSVNDASRFIIGFSLVWYSFGYKIN